MKKWILALAVAGLVTTLGACNKQKEQQDPEWVSIEEMPISEPPAFELPKPVVRPIGEDDVWKADSKKLFGFAQPEQREILECDETRYCAFVARLTRSEVKSFLEKYYPYQEYKYYPAVDLYELLPDIKEEYRGDAIVPSLDPLVVKPRKDEAVFISISWSPKHNSYVWRYKSGLARKEELEAYEQSIRDERNHRLAVAKKILAAGNFNTLTEEERVMFGDEIAMAGSEDAEYRDYSEALASIRRTVEELEAENKAEEVQKVEEDDVVPTLEPIKTLN